MISLIICVAALTWLVSPILHADGNDLSNSAANKPPTTTTANNISASNVNSATAAQLAALPTATLPTLQVNSTTYDPEQELIVALEAFLRGETELALQQTEEIVTKEPTFRLAQLIYGDLLSVKSGQPANTLGLQGKQREKTLALLDEARIRWRSHNSKPELELIPQPIVQMPASQKHAIVVDLANSRLYLAENQNGIGRIIKSFYASIGKSGANKRIEGDGKTPVGVYHVTDWLDPSALPDLYGTGAFPINYPNAWDKSHKRTGSGIWLHGVPSNTFSRPPRSSRGCVALTNKNLDFLKPYIRPGTTTVVLSDNLTWLTEREARQQQQRLIHQIEMWRKDWESLNTKAYLAHYADDFTYNGLDLAAFSEHKHRVNKSKQWLKIELGDLGVTYYPGEDLYVATFFQKYRSNNFNGAKRKQQYWQKSADGKWKIFREINL